MIEKTIDDDVNEYSYRLQSQGLKLETYLKYTGMDMKGFREGFKERAETQVRLNLALEKIIEKEKIRGYRRGYRSGIQEICRGI